MERGYSCPPKTRRWGQENQNHLLVPIFLSLAPRGPDRIAALRLAAAAPPSTAMAENARQTTTSLGMERGHSWLPKTRRWGQENQNHLLVPIFLSLAPRGPDRIAALRLAAAAPPSPALAENARPTTTSFGMEHGHSCLPKTRRWGQENQNHLLVPIFFSLAVRGTARSLRSIRLRPRRSVLSVKSVVGSS